MSKSILMFVADEYEELELHYPKYRLMEAEKAVKIAGDKANQLYKGKHGYPAKSDLCFEDVNVNDYDGLVIPGGYAPDKLRRLPKVLEITREFHRRQKMIAFICHAGWVPISAKILKDVRCASFFAIKDDMISAGCIWEDKAVITDQHFISSRTPDDLPLFGSAIIKYLAESKHDKS